jgi:hypothetical protein
METVTKPCRADANRTGQTKSPAFAGLLQSRIGCGDRI